MSSSRTLDEICDKIVDCPHKTAPTAEQPYAYAVGTKAIRDGHIDISRAKPVDARTYEEWIARLRPEPGDIILCREAPVGEAALIPAKPRICLGQRTVLLRPDRERVDPRYLAYALHGPQAQARFHALASGSTVAHLNVADVRSLELGLPPLPDQRRAAGVLAALDRKITITREAAGQLAAIAGELVKQASSRTSQTTTLSELCELKKVRTKDYSEEPLLDLKRIPRNALAPFGTWGTGSELTSSVIKFDRRDTLFGSIRPYQHKVVIAPRDGVTNTSVFVLRAKRPDDWGLVGLLASSEACIDYSVRYSEGTKMPVIKWPSLAEFRVPDFGAEDRARITTAIHPLLNRMLAGVDEVMTLTSIRNELLPKLISGEISIPHTYDPSGVLDEVTTPPAADIAEAKTAGAEEVEAGSA